MLQYKIPISSYLAYTILQYKIPSVSQHSTFQVYCIAIQNSKCISTLNIPILLYCNTISSNTKFQVVCFTTILQYNVAIQFLPAFSCNTIYCIAIQWPSSLTLSLSHNTLSVLQYNFYPFKPFKPTILQYNFCNIIPSIEIQNIFSTILFGQ